MDYLKMLFGNLANENKFKIMRYLLRFNTATPTELKQIVKTDETLISHYLNDLKKAKFIKCKKEGRNNIYSLNPKMRTLLTTLEISLSNYKEKI